MLLCGYKLLGLNPYRVYCGGVECDLVNPETNEFYGPLTDNELTCLPRTQLVGPVNCSMYVTHRGPTSFDKWGMFIDSQDNLHQHIRYPGKMQKKD